MSRVPRPKKPTEVLVRMYHVGFGDCFLVTFRYSSAPTAGDPRKTRHMLVDFGTTQHPDYGTATKPRRVNKLKEIAADIAAVTEGHLDVVVATHRHADHVSAFTGERTKALIEAVQPSLVIRPWSDDPALAEDAPGPDPLDAASRRFLRVLDAGDRWLEKLAILKADAPPVVELPPDLDPQLKNPDSIACLDGWSTDDRGRYVKAGDELDVRAVLPGVELQVLGPPTLDQVPGLASEASKHGEYWATNQPALPVPEALGGNPGLLDAYRALAGPDGIGEARWILTRMHEDDLTSLFTVARAFDDALNNTSIILLLTVGSRSMLLTGDAQVENWSPVLAGLGTNRGLSDRLADLDLYKVGHHGSRNANPRTLFGLWEARNRVPADLVTLMSTLPGKHGKDNPVPKKELIEALERISTLVRSDTTTEEATHIELRARTTGAKGFEVVTA